MELRSGGPTTAWWPYDDVAGQLGRYPLGSTTIVTSGDSPP